MGTVRRDKLIALGLAALAFAVALVQRPGMMSADTKIGLHVDPASFLASVVAAWSPTEDLGHVQGGQYSGYLLPMGPFFALGQAIGLAPWLVHRLWLGVLLAVAVWGTLRLLDALHGRPRGVAHVVAGLVVLLNPYVVVFTARTTVTLLGYAALPWLLLAVHRGLRVPRSWWWPAAFAVAVACTGGGVNAAVTAWLLLGPVLLALYERAVGGVDWRALLAFGWRTATATALASVWWVVPVLVQAGYGVDFLRFTEQPGTIWSTTSLPESLRLMGYWLSYLGVGYGGTLRPLFSGGGVMLFSIPVVLAGLLLPGLALAGFVWTRRWRYGPFFLVLVLVGLLAMTAGYPEGTPLRRAMNFTYNHLEAVRFLRTSYKAGPLVALGLACLAGVAAARLPRWALAGILVLLVVASWPLATGRALDSQLLFERVPPAWSKAAEHVDRAPGDRRAVVLPGQLYAYYDWGGTVDAVLPALADRPVAVRYAVPYADLRSVDLLWTLDGLVQQRRALPGQLGPLLDLVSAGTVVAGADDDRRRSGAVPAGTAADMLDQLGPHDRAWGPVRRERRVAGTLGGPRRLPRVRAWDRAGRPLVRVVPDGPALVVDGGADGIAALAALGALDTGLRLAYAGDLDAGELRRAADGGEVVISDSNRRRALAAARMTQNHGPTLAADEPFSPDAAVLDLFPAHGSDGQTVAVLEGVAALRAPLSPAFSQFPERRPFAALDGDPATHWQADRALAEERHWLELTFEEPRDIEAVELMPYSDRLGRVTAVEVGGRTYDVHDGWNRLEVGLEDVASLRVRIARVQHPDLREPNPGGLRELRIPGVRVTEALRPPVVAERALASYDLSNTSLSYVFERTTADDPFRPNGAVGTPGAGLVRDRHDAEPGLERLIDPPAARRWTADGWATAAGPDSELDRLAGVRQGFESSGRFEGRPGLRASSAFDGTSRAWIGTYERGRPAWIEWTVPRPVTVRELRLAPARERVRRPTVVRVAGMTVPVVDGSVTLPRPVRARRFRLEIVDAAFPTGTPGFIRQRRAVGIGEIEGAGVPRVRVPRSGALNARCGDLEGTIGDQRVALRPEGDIADLDAGTPLRVRSCRSISLTAGPARLSMPPRVLAPHILRLRSKARGSSPAAPGRVVDAGEAGRNARRRIRLDLEAPGWLIFGQAYSAGWRASCDGRDLGAPEPFDGYAMGWRVAAGCRDADVWFAPDRAVRIGYWVSAPILLALVLLLVVRRPPARREGRPPDLPETDPVGRMPARRAAVAAVVAGAALGFVFAARSAPLIALGTFLILWRGIGTRALIAAAGALLVVAVPLLTVAIPVRDPGGFNFEYAHERITVHWVAVAAVVLLVLALARVLSTATGRRATAPRSVP